ncbi:4932_t:CDS:2, partial [Funneliformis geosporum]
VLDLERVIGEDILDLLVAADELLLEELITYAQTYLIQKKSSWVQRHMIEVLHTVFQLVSCKKLQEYCLETICENPIPFFELKNFSTLDNDILYQLLCRDDLQVEEVLVWDYLIKWGIYQTMLLESEYDDYQSQSEQSEAENQQVQQKRHRHVHHRKSNSTSSVMTSHTTPYPLREKNVSNEIFEDIMAYHMNNMNGVEPKACTLFPRLGHIPIESNIIKPIHAAILSNWIYLSIPVAAIFEHQSGGLNFGGGDLNVNDRIVSCQKNMQSYEHRILDIDNYQAEEFEVFSITTNFI